MHYSKDFHLPSSPSFKDNPVIWILWISSLSYPKGSNVGDLIASPSVSTDGDVVNVAKLFST